MEKYLSKDQVKVMLQNAPKNTTPGGIVNALVSQGYKLEGFNDKPAAPAQPGFLDRVKTDVNNAGSTISDAIQGQGQFAGQNPIQRGFKAAEVGLSTPLQLASEALPHQARNALATVGDSFQQGVGAIGDLASRIPGVQDAVMNHPNAVNAAETGLNVLSSSGNIANNLLAAEGSNKLQNKIVDTTNKVVDGTQNLLSKSPEQLAGNLKTSFKSNLDKALPVLKNDVRNLPARYEKSQTAFTDLVANKDSLGLQTESGVARLPENFTETVQAQQSRLKNIYAEYSQKLSGVDKTKFEDGIHNEVFKQIDDINAKLAKENSKPARTALTSLKNELGSLRDLSPEGVQNFVEDLNQRTKTAPGAPLTPEQIKTANLAGQMKGVLDSSIEKIDGSGYQELRNLYGAHKALQDQLLRASAKELRNAPGLTSTLSNLGLTAEGINFLLTHNPASLVTGLGIKGVAEFTKYLKSPQRALRNIYSDIETHLNTPKPLSPQNIIPTATNTNIPIDTSIPKATGKSSFIQRIKDTPNKQGGFAVIPGKSLVDKAGENFIRPNEAIAMRKYIDSARGGLELPATTEDFMYTLFEKLDINPQADAKKIAIKLENYLNGKTKLTQPLFKK